MLFKTLAAALLMCFGLSALAKDDLTTAYTAVQGKDWVTVFPSQPCPEAIQSLVPPEYRAELRHAVGHFDDKDYQACFIVHDGGVFLIFEDGDAGGPIPTSAFHGDKEAKL